jgi:hypothetical protein
MPLLNELLEQAIAECVRLTDEAQEAEEAVGQVVDRADSLVSGVVTDGERTSQGLEILAETLVDAHEDLQTAIDEPVKAALQQILDRAQVVQTRAGQLEEKVAQDVADLAAETHRIDTDLQERVVSTSNHFQGVGEAMAEIEALALEHIQTTRTAIGALEDAVEQGRDALGQARDELMRELDAAEAAARSQATAYTGGIQTLLSRQTHALIGLANAMISAHNDAVVDCRQQFAETIPSVLRQAAADVTLAMEALHTLCEDRTPPLRSRALTITKVVSDALDALDRIRAAAAAAGGL